MKKLLAISAIASLLSVPNVLDAAIMTDITQEKPLEDVFFSIAATTNTGLWSGRRWANGPTSSAPSAGQAAKGQSFFATEEVNLKEVVFRAATAPDLSEGAIVGANALGAEFELKIYLFEDSTSQSPLEEVYSDSGTLPGAIAKGDYIHFQLGELVKLEGGKQYGIVLFFKEPAMNQYIGLMNGTAYSNGIGLAYSDNGWINGVADYEVYLVTIPEPSSVAFIALGGVCAATMVLRSRRTPKLRR